MRALLVDHGAPGGVRLGETADPDLSPSQALIRVETISLNYGELQHLPTRAAGEVPGWDAAGVVVIAAADGSGPPAGTRVLTWDWDHAWAELRAVETREIMPLPDELDFGAAAALPVAGISALRALRRLGPVVGERVLVTGASSGAGRYAVQLAAQAGAQVVAVVGAHGHGHGLTDLGAAEIVTGLEAVTEPIFGALDTVGGPGLITIFELLRDDGTVISIGSAASEPTMSPSYATAGTRRLESFMGGPDTIRELSYLVKLTAAGRLDPQIGWRGGWGRFPEAAEALLGRTIPGKAVLDLS